MAKDKVESVLVESFLVGIFEGIMEEIGKDLIGEMLIGIALEEFVVKVIAKGVRLR